MIVNFGAKWRITGHELCWQLERHGGAKRGWRPVSYHSSLSHAVHTLFQREVRLLDVEIPDDGLIALTTALDRVSTDIKRALGPLEQAFKESRR